MMPQSQRLFARAFAYPMVLGAIVAAQNAAAQNAELKPNVSVAVTYDVAHSNTTQLNTVWLNGGSAELNVAAPNGLGMTASVVGFHSGNIANEVSLNLVATTFGPSFCKELPVATYHLTLFGHGLLGQANGFGGLYPALGGTTSSSNGLAVNVGGGADIQLRKHFGVRLIEASWLRTQLPNAALTTQNNLTLGAGIVFHSR